jgi:hypothetical protein
MSIGTSCLEAVGLTPPEGSRSKSIFSSGNPVTIAESAGRGFCDVKNDDLHFAIATDRHKLLVTLAGNEKFFLTELYDLDVDPEENSNVVCQEAMKPTIRKLLSHLWRERGEIMKLRELDQIKLDEYLVWQIPDTQ